MGQGQAGAPASPPSVSAAFASLPGWGFARTDSDVVVVPREYGEVFQGGEKPALELGSPPLSSLPSLLLCASPSRRARAGKGGNPAQPGVAPAPWVPGSLGARAPALTSTSIPSRFKLVVHGTAEPGRKRNVT